MSIEFLGQFFIERGGVTADQLREALALMEQHNPALGTLAVQAGYLSPDQVAELYFDQRAIDQPFGELAVRRGLLTRKQLQQLLEQQAATALGLGPALVRLGHLTAERLSELEEAYEDEVASVRESAVELPGLSSHILTETVLGLFYRVFVRTIHPRIELLPGAMDSSAPGYAHAASLLLRGSQNMLAVLETDSELAEVCADALASHPVAATDSSLLGEALGELLNLTLGSVVGLLETTGEQFWIDPPRYQAVSRGGESFELVTDRGRGWLHLNPNPEPYDEPPEGLDDGP